MNVKFIVIDMYSPYISLILKLFPNARIIIDKFHLVQLISRALNKTRINIMKKDKKNYKYFKCKNCKAQLRVPKGKGKINVTCPKCKTKFSAKS